MITRRGRYTVTVTVPEPDPLPPITVTVHTQTGPLTLSMADAIDLRDALSEALAQARIRSRRAVVPYDDDLIKRTLEILTSYQSGHVSDLGASGVWLPVATACLQAILGERPDVFVVEYPPSPDVVGGM